VNEFGRSPPLIENDGPNEPELKLAPAGLLIMLVGLWTAALMALLPTTPVPDDVPKLLVAVTLFVALDATPF
jgi:hypothetical protein